MRVIEGMRGAPNFRCLDMIYNYEFFYVIGSFWGVFREIFHMSKISYNGVSRNTNDVFKNALFTLARDLILIMFSTKILF